MGIIKSGYTFTDKNEDWATRKATAIRLNKLIEESLWNGATNSDGYAPDDGLTPNDPTSLSYTSGVESIQLSWLWTQNTPALKTWIYENTTSTLPASPSFSVGQDQRTFFRENLVAGTTRYYWIKVEARNGRFSNVVGPIAATVASWPVTDTITTNLAKKITRSATAPVAPNEGDVWINTSQNNILYRYESGVWNRYQDTRVDSIANEYVLMVTPTAAGPSQRILGFRATNQDGGKLISSATRSANVVTIVTSTAHGYSNGNLVSMTGLGYSTTNPNGSYTVTVSNTTTFTYLLPSGSGTETYTVSGAYTAKGTEFVVQADYFSIINSDGTAQESPFTVTGGVVYIKDALIKNVSAGKLTAGTITSQSITISDGSTPGSGLLQSSGYSTGVSGWQIKGTGDAEFNSITVRNGSIISPTVTSATFTNALVINSTIGIRRSVNNAVLTITGASNNGSSNGAQIDLVGNDYPTAGAGGYLLLQAGQGAASEIRMHTNVSPAANVGVERLVIDTYGLVNVRRELSSGSVYTTDAGNLWVDGNIGIGSSAPTSSNTSQGGINASGTISANGQINAGGQISGYVVKANYNGTAAAPAFTFADTDTGMYYDSTNKIGFSGGGTARLYVSSDRVTIDQVLKLASTGGTTPASAQDGTIWYDGTNFKAQTGGTVYTINLV
jgi:hypothetical protein